MSKTRARVLLPNRKQLEFRASDLESVLIAYRTGIEQQPCFR